MYLSETIIFCNLKRKYVCLNNKFYQLQLTITLILLITIQAVIQYSEYCVFLEWNTNKNKNKKQKSVFDDILKSFR